MRSKKTLAGGAALLVLALGGGGVAKADRLVSNSELLRRALRQAADSMVAAMPPQPHAHVVILPAAGQRVEWAVENQLAASARDHAGRISFHGPMGDTTTTDPDAPIDTTASPPP